MMSKIRIEEQTVAIAIENILFSVTYSESPVKICQREPCDSVRIISLKFLLVNIKTVL